MSPTDVSIFLPSWAGTYEESEWKYLEVWNHCLPAHLYIMVQSGMDDELWIKSVRIDE